jgi:mono/diheme cytochrome c family protein
MIRRSTLLSLAAVGALGIAPLALTTQLSVAPALAAPAKAAQTAVERGRYLVTVMVCNDCHTPWKMGEQGPEPDMSRMLSGHPESLPITEAPRATGGPWMLQAAATMTAWAGPWGVSFTANLTPDPETGIGRWTPETFITAIRTGRHEGQGRPILPPMPWKMIRNATDEDLRAIFAYLQTVPPVRNRVPQPIEPPQGN